MFKFRELLSTHCKYLTTSGFSFHLHLELPANLRLTLPYPPGTHLENELSYI